MEDTITVGIPTDSNNDRQEAAIRKDTLLDDITARATAAALINTQRSSIVRAEGDRQGGDGCPVPLGREESAIGTLGDAGDDATVIDRGGEAPIAASAGQDRQLTIAPHGRYGPTGLGLDLANNLAGAIDVACLSAPAESWQYGGSAVLPDHRNIGVVCCQETATDNDAGVVQGTSE